MQALFGHDCHSLALVSAVAAVGLVENDFGCCVVYVVGFSWITICLMSS